MSSGILIVMLAQIKRLWYDFYENGKARPFMVVDQVYGHWQSWDFDLGSWKRCSTDLFETSGESMKGVFETVVGSKYRQKTRGLKASRQWKTESCYQYEKRHQFLTEWNSNKNPLVYYSPVNATCAFKGSHEINSHRCAVLQFNQLSFY